MINSDEANGSALLCKGKTKIIDSKSPVRLEPFQSWVVGKYPLQRLL